MRDRHLLLFLRRHVECHGLFLPIAVSLARVVRVGLLLPEGNEVLDDLFSNIVQKVLVLFASLLFICPDLFQDRLRGFLSGAIAAVALSQTSDQPLPRLFSTRSLRS